MKAVILNQEQKFEFKEVTDSCCASCDVRVEVYAAGICGSDIHKIQSGWRYPLPAVMGHEFSGVVVEIGQEVTNVAVGQSVVGIPLLPCHQCQCCQKGQFGMCVDYRMIGTQYHGAFAENVVLPAKNVLPIGEMDLEEAAMIEPLAVSLHGVMNLRPQIGDVAVVFGVGTIGLLTIQCLFLAGVKEVIAVDINDDKLAAAKALGCRYTVNPLVEDLEKRVFSFTDGVGADLALECAGSKITQEQCLLVTKKQGKVGYLGIAYADVLLKERAFENIFRKELTLQGFWNSYSAPFPGKEWLNAINFINQGRFKLNSLISHRYPLQQVKEAFEMILSRKESYNKVMILPKEVIANESCSKNSSRLRQNAISGTN